MYIRQECLLSLDEIIKYQPKTRLELILSELDFSDIMKDLSQHHATHGPKGRDELALTYSLVAMQVNKLQHLKNDGKSANWGAKRDTDGNKICWFGYKLHILADCKSELPLSILLSPASYSDGDLAIPLIKKFLAKYSGVLNPKYYIMDSGYDFQKNYDYITNEVKSQAIIAYNPRGQYAPPEGLNKKFQPVYSMGYALTYWGKDGNYLKFKCSHATGKVNCPYRMTWCSISNYGYCHKINYKKNNRLFGYPYRNTEDWQNLYNQRTSIERCNSRLKELLNINNMRSSGVRKAKIIALLNCMALISGTIAVNQKSNDLKNIA